MVFETHLYSWSGIGTLKLRDIWTKQPLNRICANSKRGIDYSAGFLTFGKNNNSSVFPLIFTEFGFDQEGSSEGGYYLREDKVQLEETFGVFDASWEQLRFPNFTEKFQLLQRKIQDPTSNLPTSNILYHPLSGQCVQINSKNELELGSCESKVRWAHKDGAHHDQILLVGTKRCLTSTGEGNPAVVSSSSSDCQSNSKSSSWKHVSLSKLHLASSSMDEHGKQMLCLHKDSNSPRIVTQRCICVDDDSTCLDDPRAQWFQLVPTNV
ncbi:glycosyl hydrolase 5 family protein-like [Senna tora]|uniref:Glycosyl hydrolase 5 family protein-like n=1 Tax=Senna tora TaxID=362788 RepID=A0A834WJA2_9FABA|nr:glycosyl hydrolase 5 family protein-like [Senna tora]